MKIVVTGKNGLLSLELQKISKEIIPLSSLDYDIIGRNVIKKLDKINPDIVIHSAAVTNSKEVIKNPIKSIRTNIVGTANISEYCINKNKRLVYISTDYVYSGKNGNHSEDDSLFPENEYAWTKLGGECSAILVPNSLIIRTSFGSNIFPYSVAWTNLITSKDYVDIVAPKILKAAVSKITGILNIGSPAKSMYEYASKRNVISKGALDKNKDFSLNLKKYEQAFGD